MSQNKLRELSCGELRLVRCGFNLMCSSVKISTAVIGCCLRDT